MFLFLAAKSQLRQFSLWWDSGKATTLYIIWTTKCTDLHLHTQQESMYYLLYLFIFNFFPLGVKRVHLKDTQSDNKFGIV